MNHRIFHFSLHSDYFDLNNNSSCEMGVRGQRSEGFNSQTTQSVFPAAFLLIFGHCTGLFIHAVRCLNELEASSIKMSQK